MAMSLFRTADRRLARGFAVAVALLCAGAPAEAQTASPEARLRAEAFMRDMLALEGSGERLKELLGRAPSEVFYRSVDYDSSEEPGWDEIAVASAPTLGETSCKPLSATETACAVTVALGSGFVFSREDYWPATLESQQYEVRVRPEGCKIVSRLPRPFLTPAGAVGFLGQPPYDQPRLLALKQQLERR